ncbi:hypothetical protein K0M31_013260 [Melipona bicolor]|uniref:Uncharacterized protein n=1 Tax=Melipona bicolor TaxID=60889 RepID=A0AA40FI72_9HYME|nr:hypothetical protein K0M31_013260 [Melipona bicolor]
MSKFLLADDFGTENKVYLSENRSTPIFVKLFIFFWRPGQTREQYRKGLRNLRENLFPEDKNENENEELEGAASGLFDFSARECAFIFNRIAAAYASRQGENVPPWKIKFYCFLLTDKAREARLGMPSTEIDHH